jgi:hypothetical protein
MPQVTPARQAVLTMAAAKAARAAGVKPAALIRPVTAANRSLPKPAFEMPQSKLNANSASATAPAAAPKKTAGRAKPKAVPARGKLVKGKTSKTAAKNSGAVVHHVHASQSPVGKTSPDVKRNTTQTVVHSAGPKPSPAIAKQLGSSD